MTHYDTETIEREAEQQEGRKVFDVQLKDGDTAVNPVSTKDEFVGPGTVRYTIWADGGWDVRIEGGVRIRDL